MWKLVLMAGVLLAALGANAQTLDWSDGVGGCRVATVDTNGVAYPATAQLSCRVRIPAISWSLTMTGLAPGASRTFTPPFAPGATVNFDAFAESDVSLVPGVWGPTTPATPVVLRRQHEAPAEPALLP